jgi:hypothetical protein
MLPWFEVQKCGRKCEWTMVLEGDDAPGWQTSKL